MRDSFKRGVLKRTNEVHTTGRLRVFSVCSGKYTVSVLLQDYTGKRGYSFYTPFCVGRDLSQYFSGVFKSKASCKEASCLCRRLRASALFFVVSDHIGHRAGDYAAGIISRE